MWTKWKKKQLKLQSKIPMIPENVHFDKIYAHHLRFNTWEGRGWGFGWCCRSGCDTRVTTHYWTELSHESKVSPALAILSPRDTELIRAVGINIWKVIENVYTYKYSSSLFENIRVKYNITTVVNKLAEFLAFL